MSLNSSEQNYKIAKSLYQDIQDDFFEIENNSEEDDDNESSVILKFCCLCYDCFHSQKIIEKVVDKLFDKENMAILDKSVGKNTQESLH